jgi:hypothetical protein
MAPGFGQPGYDPTAGQTDVAGTGTAEQSVDEMAQALADAKIRSTLSQYEAELNDMMAKASSSFAQQQAQLDAQRAQLAGQIAAVRQQTGPPAAVLLSASLAQRVKTIADSNPDISRLHFAGVVDQANRLSDAVNAAANGQGPAADAERLANSVVTWFTRSHPRVSSKVLEMSHAVLDEAERIIEALPELVPAVAAVASAV